MKLKNFFRIFIPTNKQKENTILVDQNEERLFSGHMGDIPLQFADAKIIYFSTNESRVYISFKNK